MDKTVRYVLGIVAWLVIFYLIGPSTPDPSYSIAQKKARVSVQTLEREIIQHQGIKPDNEARIFWHDSIRKNKTEYVILYLHGFTASWAEGEPVHRNAAKAISANLYCPLLYGHGMIDIDAMKDFTSEKLYQSAYTALENASALGEKIIIMGTSTGGTLALNLAARFPNQVHALILYSPNIKIFDKTAVITNNPWGLQLTKLVFGNNYRSYDADSLSTAYWNTKYRVEAIPHLQAMLETSMNEAVFKAIKCPVFVGYYYKNEEEQDQVVQVNAIQEMFYQLGTKQKLMLNFPETGNHVIASYIKSKNTQKVEKCTIAFLKQITK
jgi:esterase/lipase